MILLVSVKCAALVMADWAKQVSLIHAAQDLCIIFIQFFKDVLVDS